MTEVDKYIEGLQYDPETVLADDSYRQQAPADKMSSEAKEGKFYVYTTEFCSEEKENADWGFIDSLNARIHPGAMVLCNQHLLDNNPDLVNVGTKEATFAVDLPGKPNFKSEITHSAVTGKVDAVAGEWCKNNPDGNVGNRIIQHCIEAHSKKQLSLELGFKLEESKTKFNIDFNMIDRKEARDWILVFEQPYYTVALDTFSQSSDIIADGVTVDDLKTIGVDDKNPIGIVRSVTYGRKIYAHFHTEDINFDLHTKCNAFVPLEGGSLDAKAKADLEEINSKGSMDMFVYGSGTNDWTRVDPNKIPELIQNGVNFTSVAQAFPISYSVDFMKAGGSKQAAVKFNTQYTKVKTEVFNDFNLKMGFDGAYVGKYFVEWDEISYNENGELVTNHKTWNIGKVTSGYEDNKRLPGNTRNLRILAEGYVFFGVKRTIYDKIVPINSNSLYFHAWGSSLDRRSKVEY